MNFAFDSLGNLRVFGTISGTLEITAVADNTFDIVDGGTTQFAGLEIPGSITIQSSGADDNIFIDLGGFSTSGSFIINSGGGVDVVEINQVMFAGGIIGGDVILNGVNNFNMTTGTVGGNITMNHATENVSGSATLFSVFIGRNFTLVGSNAFDDLSISDTQIGNSLTFTAGGGFVGDSFTIDAASFVGGGVIFRGGAGDDFVTLDGFVGGSVYAHLGGSLGSNAIGVSGSIGGNLTVFAGFGVDFIDVFAGSLVGGNVYVNAGNGDNTFAFGGSSSGRSFLYQGGSGLDTVFIDPTANLSLARTRFSLGAGDDSLFLDSDILAALFVDFGAGTDSFLSSVILPLSTVLFNLP